MVLGATKIYSLTLLVIAVGIGIIVCGILCYIFGIEEVKDMIDKTKLRLARK